MVLMSLPVFCHVMEGWSRSDVLVYCFPQFHISRHLVEKELRPHGVFAGDSLNTLVNFQKPGQDCAEERGGRPSTIFLPAELRGTFRRTRTLSDAFACSHKRLRGTW